MLVLRSNLLSSVRPFYALDDEKGKSDVEKQREGIKTTNSNSGDDKKEDENNKSDDKIDDKEGDKKGEEDNKESDEDGEDGEDEDKEGDENKEEEKELSAEQKEIAKLQKTVERLQKRIGKTTGEKAAIAQQLTDAKKSLEAKVEAGEGLTEEEVERRAEIKANEKTAKRAFEAAQNKLLKEATKVNKDFKTKLDEIVDDLGGVEAGGIPGAMIGILEDLDNGGAVLAYLADNPEDYEEVIGLNVAKMSNRLNRISDKIIEAAKPPIKKISKVPEPPAKDLKGNQSSPGVLNPKNMNEFVRLRNQQVEDRRKARLR